MGEGAEPSNNKSAARKMPYNKNLRQEEQDINIQRLMRKVDILTKELEESKKREARYLALLEEKERTTEVPTVEVRNQYDQLSDPMEGTSDMNITITPPKPPVANNKNSSINNKTSINNKINTSTKLPPINIFGQTAKQIAAKLESLQVTKFSVKKTAGDKHVVRTEQLGDFQKIRQSLKDENAQHFSYTPAEIKNKTYILRGLDGDEDPKEVMDALNGLNTTSVEFVSVKKLQTKQASSLFIIQATASSNEANILKIDKLNHVIIKWEKLQRRDILQCRRCQRLGHTASNCGMQYRCVKCNSPHAPGQCKLPAGVQHEHHEVFCISCNEYGHPASYHGCPQIVKFKQNIAARKQTDQRATEEKNKQYNNFTRPSVSFRDALQNTQTPNQQTTTEKPTQPAAIDASLAIMLANIVRETLEPIQQQLKVQANHINEIYSMFTQL